MKQQYPRLRNAMLGLAADISHEVAQSEHPVAAAAIWQRAQLRERYKSRQRTMARATLPLRLMSAITILLAVSATAFILHQSSGSPAAELTAPHASLLGWAGLSLVFMVASAWLLLRMGRGDLTT